MYVASLVAQMVKNLPAMQETWIQPVGQKDALEKRMATCSSILAWEVLRTEAPFGLQSMGSQRARHHWATKKDVYEDNNCEMTAYNCKDISAKDHQEYIYS